ncbi:MAG: type IV secretion system DNA-binding domain-containing protein [Patescibacteria group bacterium]
MPDLNKPPKSSEITFFAKTNFRNQKRKFGIKTDDRRRHTYLIGKTGMGKTTVLENMIIQDIRAGKGVAVADPHGDLVDKLIDYIPSYRMNDVIYFNPADVDHPIAFNILENIDPNYRPLVASGLVGVFKKIWADSWGPRLEYILNNAILSLLDYQGSTLLGITRILVDKKYREKVVRKVKDPIVKAFWQNEYAQYNERFRTEAIAPIQNKIGQFLSNSIIRNVVGQPKSTIEMRDVMDNQKILLMNLAKGRIGEESSALLGAMMITKLQLAAMSRVDIPEDDRKDFYLYVDEFQNFATDSFANILSEARKYRLDLTIAHQYIEQLEEKVSAAVFGNVGTIICFRVGAADAEFLEREFTPNFDENDLVNLAKFDIYLKLMIDGVSSDAFSATTLPPLAGPTGNRDKVIAVTRERYTKTREKVEEKIVRWSGVEEIYRESAKSEGDTLKDDRARYKKKDPSKELKKELSKDIHTEQKLEKIVEAPKEEISLQEALGREPQTFSGSPRPKNKKKKHRDDFRTRGQERYPQRNDQPRKEQFNSSRNEQRQPQRNEQSKMPEQQPRDQRKQSPSRQDGRPDQGHQKPQQQFSQEERRVPQRPAQPSTNIKPGQVVRF